PFRIRHDASAADEERWRTEKTFAIEYDQDGEPIAHLVIERRVDATPVSEAGRSVARRGQELEGPHSWGEDEAVRLAERLGLQSSIGESLRVAARLHDEGKRARRWQEAFSPVSGSSRDEKRILAKSRRAPRRSVLGKYRHELGSLPRMEK